METRMTCPLCHGSTRTLINYRFSGNQTTRCARCGGRGTVPAPTPVSVPVTTETATSSVDLDKTEE